MTYHASEVRERYYRAYLIKDEHIGWIRERVQP